MATEYPCKAGRFYAHASVNGKTGRRMDPRPPGTYLVVSDRPGPLVLPQVLMGQRGPGPSPARVPGVRVLVACEFSGIVRDAFAARGHEATSCDFLPSEAPGNHYEGDVRDLLYDEEWDLMIAHPPCTHLAVSGARWFKDKLEEQKHALDFVSVLLDAPIPRIALENPVSVISTKVRKPDQIVQPWEFGHGETKRTCLWLKGLPLLRPTKVVPGRVPRVHHASPSPDRWKVRSRTYEGMADAMAEQWG